MSLTREQENELTQILHERKLLEQAERDVRSHLKEVGASDADIETLWDAHKRQLERSLANQRARAAEKLRKDRADFLREAKAAFWTSSGLKIEDFDAFWETVEPDYVTLFEQMQNAELDDGPITETEGPLLPVEGISGSLKFTAGEEAE